MCAVDRIFLHLSTWAAGSITPTQPSPIEGEGSKERVWVGVIRPARRRSSDGLRRDWRGPRRSKTAECDTLRFAGSHCARFPAERSDRVGRRRFPRSTGPRGTQSRQCRGRLVLGGGTCNPSFDASAVFARPAFPPRSSFAVKCELARLRR